MSRTTPFGGAGSSRTLATPRTRAGRDGPSLRRDDPLPRGGPSTGGDGTTGGPGLRAATPSSRIGGKGGEGRADTPRGPAGTRGGGVLSVPHAAPADGIRALRHVAHPIPGGSGGNTYNNYYYYGGPFGYYGSFFYGFWWGSWYGYFPYFYGRPWFPYWCYYWWGYAWGPYGYTVPSYYYPTIDRYAPSQTIIVQPSSGDSGTTIVVNGEEGSGIPGGSPAASLDPFEFHLRLGDYHFRQGEFDQASEEYKQAVLEDPESGVARFALADALFALGDYHFAAYSLRKAIELQPDWLSRQFLKRDFYGDPAVFDTHMAAVRTWLEVHPFDEAALFVLAYNLYRNDQGEEARAVLGRLEDIREGDPAYAALREAIL